MTTALGVHLDASDRTPSGRGEHLLRLLSAQEKRFSMRMRAIESGMEGIREQLARVECSGQMTDAQQRELAKRVAEHLAAPMKAQAVISAATLRRAYALGALLVAAVTGGGGVYLRSASSEAQARQELAAARASAEVRELRRELQAQARRESFE